MKISLILFVIFISLAAFADTNAVAGGGAMPALTPTVKYPWESSVSAGLTLTRGNSDTTMFTADFLTQRKTPVDEYRIGLGGGYGDQDSKQTVNFYKAFAQWNHLLSERFYAYTRVEGLRDIIADLDYRLSIGPGVGYYLLKQTNTTLAAEVGTEFEAQDLGGQDQVFDTVRLAERFEHKFNAHARLWESAEIFPQVDKFDNYVVNVEIGVETSLTKSFSLKTFLDDSYANRPAPDKLKNDAKLIAAIAYKF